MRVPWTVLWWIDMHGLDGPDYIGRVAVTRQARGVGDVSVSVRPSRRGQGHGSAILAAALPVAFGRGIDSVFLSLVDETQDLPSPPVIEACGGIPESSDQTRFRFTVGKHSGV